MSQQIINFVDEEAARNTIKNVRNDKSGIDWCIISYEGTTGAAAQRLTVFAEGNGGIEALKEKLTDDMLAYCLLRETDQIDESVTVKFAFINWLGNSAPRMQKSRISIHIGPVKQFFGQFHVDHTASDKSELTHDAIMQKIMDASGSGSRVLDASGSAQVRTQAANRASVNFGRLGAGGAARPANDQVTFIEEDNLKAILKEVRSTDGADWALLTYEDPKSNHVVLAGKGSGGVSELLQHLKDDIVGYALVRKIDQIDETKALKFCFINWVGDNVNRMLRARLGTHQGAVRAFFAPFHVDISATQQSEVSDDIVLNLIKGNSGTRSNVLSDDRTIHTQKVVATRKVGDGSAPAPASSPADVATPAPASTGLATSTRPASVSTSVPAKRNTPGSNSDKIDLGFDNEETVRGGIKQVRDDNSGINWALVSYDAPRSKTLTLVGTGSGGVSEFITQLKDDIVGYGLVRLIETVDNSQTVKFCFVNWTGPNINRMQRAGLATHKGFVTELFHPYHVDLECEKPSEVSEEIIYAKIKKAAGTANYVL